MRARELMSTPVITVRPDAGLKDVAELLVTHGISGMPVVDPAEGLVGMISESDFLTKMEYGQEGPNLLDRLAGIVGTDGKGSARTAADLMKRRLVTAKPDATVHELIHLMTVYAIDRVPIVEDGLVIGIVTRADVLRTFTRPDDAITKEVLWRLQHDLWIDPALVQVQTHDGIVTVAGTVETHADVELLTRWIAATEGVVAVSTEGLRYEIDDRRIDTNTDRLR
jgi:CBS domain-containing protein